MRKFLFLTTVTFVLSILIQGCSEQKTEHMKFMDISMMFSDPQPDGPDKNFLDCLNPDSLMVLRGCKVERSMAAVAEEFDRRENRTGVNAPTFQFMRTGYFCMDNRDCTAEHLVFNRSVSLKDSFKK